MERKGNALVNKWLNFKPKRYTTQPLDDCYSWGLSYQPFLFGCCLTLFDNKYNRSETLFTTTHQKEVLNLVWGQSTDQILGYCDICGINTLFRNPLTETKGYLPLNSILMKNEFNSDLNDSGLQYFDLNLN